MPEETRARARVALDRLGQISGVGDLGARVSAIAETACKAEAFAAAGKKSAASLEEAQVASKR